MRPTTHNTEQKFQATSNCAVCLPPHWTTSFPSVSIRAHCPDFRFYLLPHSYERLSCLRRQIHRANHADTFSNTFLVPPLLFEPGLHYGPHTVQSHYLSLWHFPLSSGHKMLMGKQKTCTVRAVDILKPKRVHHYDWNQVQRSYKEI